jgi:hypothetical protein
MLVAEADRTISPDLERWYAARAKPEGRGRPWRQSLGQEVLPGLVMHVRPVEIITIRGGGVPDYF